ncbi:hypothetical protein CWS72_26275 [Telmatospirillum siberiense]|uniref:Uncharacterized protein n=1 Tax=Telmatospirillum siberiense TaxID=382514 RepID=A0A2N3PM98_9PROT|nr:hypothetical protein CWS72_26275 [Telmatospirillum siberiense]
MTSKLSEALINILYIFFIVICTVIIGGNFPFCILNTKLPLTNDKNTSSAEIKLHLSRILRRWHHRLPDQQMRLAKLHIYNAAMHYLRRPNDTST